MSEYILLEILKHNEYMLDNSIKLKEILQIIDKYKGSDK